MKPITILFSLLTILSLVACNTAVQKKYYPVSSTNKTRTTNKFPPSEPGKCYAKCYYPDIIEVGYDTVFYYKNIEEIEYTELKVIYVEKGQNWVKVKADNNCLSSNPEDCYVWCLKETEEQSVIKKIPVRPEEAILDAIEPIIYNKVVETRGFEDWTEVLCQKDITNSLLKKVDQALTDRAYPSDVEEISIKDIGKRMKKFQQDNSLITGAMTIETLNALGLGY